MRCVSTITVLKLVVYRSKTQHLQVSIINKSIALFLVLDMHVINKNTHNICPITDAKEMPKLHCLAANACR